MLCIISVFSLHFYYERYFLCVTNHLRTFLFGFPCWYFFWISHFKRCRLFSHKVADSITILMLHHRFLFYLWLINLLKAILNYKLFRLNRFMIEPIDFEALPKWHPSCHFAKGIYLFVLYKHFFLKINLKLIYLLEYKLLLA